MPITVVRGDIEAPLRALKKMLHREGFLRKVREGYNYLKPSATRARKAKEAARRRKKIELRKAREEA